MLLLNTLKLVLIALNILPYRVTHRKVLFLAYLITLVSQGKLQLNLCIYRLVYKIRLNFSWQCVSSNLLYL